MRFTKQTTKAIRHWLKDNGFEVGCRLGKEMAYEAEDNYIIVPRDYDSSLDNYFMNFLRKNGLKNDFDSITLSILHELGHFETQHLFSLDEWNNDSLVKEVIAMQDKSIEKINYEYWQTPTEFSANLWLIMYVKAFADKVMELEEIIGEYV